LFRRFDFRIVGSDRAGEDDDIRILRDIEQY